MDEQTIFALRESIVQMVKEDKDFIKKCLPSRAKQLAKHKDMLTNPFFMKEFNTQYYKQIHTYFLEVLISYGVNVDQAMEVLEDPGLKVFLLDSFAEGE